MSRKYKFHNPTAAYFVSFATVYWIDIFTRQEYFNILLESIDHCRKEKGMELYDYCFMPNHVHLIFRDSNEDPMNLLRNFKKHTAKKTLKAIQENATESRKKWLLWMFKKAGKQKGNISKYQFWQHNNKPIELWSTAVIKQKIEYIHNNPVLSGFVTNAIDWKYSSAKNFADDHTILKIDDIGFLQLKLTGTALVANER
ncbi:REP-associated tyrosine transposase [Maribacter luteus]|uniref:REP-associated tyrosine transposase n=1 Tax=Maribacter luteus TaxID=2594478 RepID=UPI0024919556|nr:transposase [Maribacter luteus]